MCSARRLFCAPYARSKDPRGSPLKRRLLRPPLPPVQTVVGIGTLTGAAGVALGQGTGACFANTDAIAAAVESASRAAGVFSCEP